MLLLIMVAAVSARILEQRDPKVDPLSLDNVVSRIVDSTMDDLRFRLRQAIYALALRQEEESPQNLDNYEDRLLNQFLGQIRKQNDSPSPPASHTMAIALETHTIDPELTHRDNKLVTADLRMLDAVDQPLVTLDSSLPLWIVISCGVTVILFLTVVLSVVVIRRRRRRKSSARLARLPDTLTISAMCLPEQQHGPGPFLERLRSQESLWTTAASMESLRQPL